MNILVTGGMGYIGSHTCVALLEEGYNVIIVDNLSNSDIKTLDKIKAITKKDLSFYNIDLTDENALNSIFIENKIDAVIHFAAFKSVGESVDKPLEYYYNNVVSTIVLAKVCKKYNVKKVVFSSSATVYGDNISPFTEDMELLKTTNPYGETKAMSERILQDLVVSNPEFNIAILRYFNPVGAHESGLIGESPKGIPNNLMPYISKVAKGELNKLKVFGDNYNTIDGTGVRDYIHVMDIAEGHVAALINIKKGVHIYNLGTGKGTSVMELIKAFEDANNIRIPYKVVNRRYGDIAECYASIDKAKKELKWSAKRNISEMCRDAWNFEKNYGK